jgi:hypothetical protein
MKSCLFFVLPVACKTSALPWVTSPGLAKIFKGQCWGLVKDVVREKVFVQSYSSLGSGGSKAGPCHMSSGLPATGSLTWASVPCQRQPKMPTSRSKVFTLLAMSWSSMRDYFISPTVKCFFHKYIYIFICVQVDLLDLSSRCERKEASAALNHWVLQHNPGSSNRYIQLNLS